MPMKTWMRRVVFGLLLPSFFLLPLATPTKASAAEEEKPDLTTGARLWRQNCGRCHYIRPPSERSDRQWEIIVKHMRLRANLTGSDARAIEEFLKASN
jgi:hypothetical protein